MDLWCKLCGQFIPLRFMRWKNRTGHYRRCKWCLQVARANSPKHDRGAYYARNTLFGLRDNRSIREDVGPVPLRPDGWPNADGTKVVMRLDVSRDYLAERLRIERAHDATVKLASER